MARSGQRVVISLIAAVLAVSAVVVLVNRFVVEAEWWQVDQQVTALPARWTGDTGPPPGPLAESWQLTTPVRHSGLSPYDQVSHAVVQGQLVVISGKGLDVRDARTGTPRWHYFRKGWVLLGWAATGGHLVAYLERSGHRGDRLLLGFDAITGGLLWRDKGEVPALIERSTLRWPAGSRVVLTTDDERTVLRGRSASGGGRLWSHPVPAGCELPEAGLYASGTGERLAVLMLACGDRRRILAVDPLTGRPRWEKRLGAGDPPAISVRDNVVTVFDGDSLHAYTAGGDELAVRTGDDLCRPVCPVAVSGGSLFIVYRSGETSRMDAVDIGSGRLLRSGEVPDYTAVTEAGGRLYALRPRLAEDLLPAGLDIIEASDGRATTVPTPLVVGQGRDAVRTWLGAAAGLLFIAVPEADGGAGERTGTGDPALRSDTRRGGADGTRDTDSGGGPGMGSEAYPPRLKQLIALRGGPGGDGPVELGGVAAGDWPDACGLLSGADLAAVRQDGGPDPASYKPRPGMARIGAVRLPHPVSCTYEPVDERRPRTGAETSAAALTVTVEWVAAGPREASALLAAHRLSNPRSRRLPGIGDEAAELGTSGTVVVRVGRSIVAVNAYQKPDVANRLAHAAADRLREQAAGGAVAVATPARAHPSPTPPP